MALLILIRDLQYNKNDRKKSIMALVQADFDLYICSQEKNQSIEDYYKVFTSTMDTINANGGEAGLHPAVYTRHLIVLVEKDLVSSNTVGGVEELTDAAKEALEKKFEKPARESATAEYLACLFLLLSDDERFKPLKREMNNNFHVLGSDSYPRNVLAAKRLMTGFEPTIVPKPAQERVPPTDVAFAEHGNDSIRDCFACGRKCPGGYRKCKNITWAKKKKITKLVETGYFNEENSED